MEADEIRRKHPSFEIGEPLDMLSVEELTSRIDCLEAEIARIRQTIEMKQDIKAAAEKIFRK